VSVALLNGQQASVDDLRALALVNYGHFTSFQVRRRAAQGMDLHLQRLSAGTRQLFGSDLDATAVRAQMRAAIADAPDCSVRVTVYSRHFDYRNPGPALDADVLVTVAAASLPQDHALRLQSRQFQRCLPEVKHIGTLPLFHHRRQAVMRGFDDALLVDADGVISEGPTWNIGFWQRGTVVWPDAPALRGTTERLLEEALSRQGVEQVTRSLGLPDLGTFDGAFACNASGLQSVAKIDETVFPDPRAGLTALRDTLASVAWVAV